ncbi:DNA ligase 3 [Parasteatoda tepidariorum]|uniref:DNA ligase 3 n=1 Tax=Parasteatoda tepidariorum TaxID=114398 RepID=UPI001C7243AF|nr:DNA ligase 3 [Parasteatoda tepidariorum]
MATNRYCVDVAKRGTAGCKECKIKIEKGVVRIAKVIPNPFTDSGGDMKQWFHVKCIFEKLSRARATTKKIDDIDDLEGWEELDDEHKPEIEKYIAEFSSGQTAKPSKKTKKQSDPVDEEEVQKEEDDDDSTPTKDDSLRQFRKICAELSEVSEHKRKNAILSKFFSKGSDGNGFKGNLYLWAKMLLPMVEKRVYNLQTKQIIKLFSGIFRCSAEEMMEHFEEGDSAGDVAVTISTFFEDSSACPPANKSTLYLQDVDKYLHRLSQVSREFDQSSILTEIAKKCTGNDLKMIIRFLKHDLRINAGPKPVLESIHPDAYAAFQASRNLKDIINRSVKQNSGTGSQKDLVIQSSLMTPVLPMLAMACKSYEDVFKRCPNGFFVEIKYDGERVQLHKKGNEFSYFSRSLKPVMAHKKMAELKGTIRSVFKQGLEGVVVKGKDGVYEPGKRHWLKIKKDYLKDDNMVDTADLIILGAFYGTGKFGGNMSTFLMGCYDTKTKKFCTVTKVHNGLTEDDIEKLQKKFEPNMKKIGRDRTQVPSWLNIHDSMVPDFVVLDPKKSSVWEITGAEFTQTDIHSAKGISIRFPRLTKVRSDKTWKEATNLEELEDLYKISKQTSDIVGLTYNEDDEQNNAADEGSSSSNEKSPVKDTKSPSSKKLKQDESPTAKKQVSKRKPQEDSDSSYSTKKTKLKNGGKGETDDGKPSNQTLSNIFSGVKLSIPDSIENFEKLRRYFIAYDGGLLQDHEQDDATHVISCENTKENNTSKTAVCVTEDWIWDCIKLQKLLSTNAYTSESPKQKKKRKNND